MLPPFPLDLVPLPADKAVALRGMVNRPFLTSQKWQLQQWRANREGAHPDLLEFERVMLRRMTKLGIPMFCPEFVRSVERQNELYALGNSRAKGGQSAHQYGCALDLVHSVKGWGMHANEWELIQHVGMELINQKGLLVQNLAILRGGYDPAHWQVVDWKHQKENYPWPKIK